MLVVQKIFTIQQAKLWLQVGLVFFFLAALFGLVMRYFFVGEVHFFTYKNIMHAHSHVAMMGWVFISISVLLLRFFYNGCYVGAIQRLLVVNTLAVIGMSITFTIQGYSALSIVFSTIHLFCTYFFAWYFLKDVKPQSAAAKMARWAVIWLVVSSIGLWAIAPVGHLLGRLHPLYFMSVQFFLHFQFNGWFIYGVLALVMHLLPVPFTLPRWSVPLLHVSLLLTYALSVSWSTPSSALFYLNSIGVATQALAFGGILFGIFPALRQFFYQNKNFSTTLLKLAFACLVFKVVVQSALVFPFVAVISYTIRLYVIGFIHIIMLGVVSFTVGSITLQKSYYGYKGLNIFGWKLIIMAFIITELLIFLQGTMIWMEKGFIMYYYEWMFYSSLLFPIGIVAVVLGNFQKPYLKLNLLTKNRNLK